MFHFLRINLNHHLCWSLKESPIPPKNCTSYLMITPSDYSYRGISAEHLEECDRLYELVQEIIPQQKSEEPEYVDHKTRPRRLNREPTPVVDVKKVETYFFNDES